MWKDEPYCADDIVVEWRNLQVHINGLHTAAKEAHEGGGVWTAMFSRLSNAFSVDEMESAISDSALDLFERRIMYRRILNIFLTYLSLRGATQRCTLGAIKQVYNLPNSLLKHPNTIIDNLLM